VLATRNHVPPAPKPRAGRPPLALDLGVRTDREANALRRAQALYRAGKLDAAAAIFGRYRSPEAQVGEAFAHWPGSTVSRLEQLQAEHRQSALLALHLGLALYWLRHTDEALAQWRRAARQPDTPYAVRAGDFLHPRTRRACRASCPRSSRRSASAAMPAPQQVAALRADAATAAPTRRSSTAPPCSSSAGPLGRAAVRGRRRLAPDDPTRASQRPSGRFDKASPRVAFGRLGPLTRVFPHAQTVRFHLGCSCSGRRRSQEARRQLTQAARETRTHCSGSRRRSIWQPSGALGPADRN
jgi:hypothetical protein